MNLNQVLSATQLTAVRVKDPSNLLFADGKANAATSGMNDEHQSGSTRNNGANGINSGTNFTSTQQITRSKP